MDERSGWLIDLYASTGGLTLWLLCDDGPRLCLHYSFSITFYAAGDFSDLRRAWFFLKTHPVDLARARRTDLFLGERDVLAITVRQPAHLPELFRELAQAFPMLDYYDADIPLPLRFAAQTGVPLLTRCRLTLDGERVTAIEALDSAWELDPLPLPLRVLKLSPDEDPAHCPPRRLRVRYERVDFDLDLAPKRAFVIVLESIIHRYDPDLILSEYGDTWLFPWLQKEAPAFNPNRDPDMGLLTKRATSYFAYGQVVYRSPQTHLFGRWHIDSCSAMMFGEYGLEGALEQGRVTGLGVQEMARKSPGAGITAMQMHTALRRGVLVPVQKQQAEDGKSMLELIGADRGGMIFQPLIGLHRNVAQIDFSSMYPSIMVNFNISPETVGRESAVEGLVPETLRPLLTKRLALKRMANELDPRDCRVGAYKARAAALKWLLVVCFGYLGYKNARFGKIESHEAVTALSRELLLQAKERAEDLGFTVSHMYVDSLFVHKEGCTCSADFAPLLEAITAQTGLAIALDGVYKWLIFPPSKRDSRVAVPNRYFGVFRDGEIKARGIALRRHDTPKFIAEAQMEILKVLAKVDDPRHAVPAAQATLQKQVERLFARRVPVEDLLISCRLSRAVEEYRVLSPAARAARQLMEAGKVVRPGMRIRFVHTYDEGGVRAWGAGEIDAKQVDVKAYRRLLIRAAEEVFELQNRS